MLQPASWRYNELQKYVYCDYTGLKNHMDWTQHGHLVAKADVEYEDLVSESSAI